MWPVPMRRDRRYQLQCRKCHAFWRQRCKVVDRKRRCPFCREVGVPMLAQRDRKSVV